MNNQNNSNEKRTIVEEGTSFKGTLAASCPIDVRGSIEGDLETPSLYVSATGAVHGRVKVGRVQSEGMISGEFDADSVELAGGVKDNTVIRARSLEVRLSAEKGKLQVIFGECELSVGDEPSERAAVEPLVAAEAPPLLIEEPAPLPVPELPALYAETKEPPTVDALGAAIREHINAREAEASVSSALVAESSITPIEADAAVVTSASDADEKLVASEQKTESSEKGSGRRKTKNGTEENASWSHPPSQPPPAG